MIPPPTKQKCRDLEEILRRMGSVLVAFSAGVDSTFLADAARRVLGEDALAVTGRSPSLPESELAEARRTAERIGIRLIEIDTRELADPRYAANPAGRCFFCKEELFRRLVSIADREGIAHVAYGAISDDLADDRPGHGAALAYGVRSPLLEAGLTKAEIRVLSKARGLPTWDKPAMACLASRVPRGQRVTAEKLKAVERAEAHLRGLGFRQIRVRHHGPLARIEVEAGGIPRFFEPGMMDAVSRAFQRIGFPKVSVDLKGYRTGSLKGPPADRLGPIPLPVISAPAPVFAHER
ncbi:MAG TPA: ATP-dependent sacrificial sulfur transferase LarE [Nitrospinota bacterium]|nr:ATP-dependent sacrificial sulfur transferase LarE [Nitrospinota bacterium]